MYELMNRDLSGFNVRKPPQTPYIFDLKLLSMDSAEHYLYEYLREASEDAWAFEEQKKMLHTRYLDWCQEHGFKHKHPDSIFGKHLKRMIPSLKDCKKVPQWSSTDKRVKHYIFPALAQCRSEFEKACKSDSSIWGG